MPRGLNIELAEKVLKQVTEHPETHNQEEWGRRTFCGTTACLAGWAVHFAHPGSRLNWRVMYSGDVETGDEIAHSVTLPEGLASIFEAGAKALGLEEGDAEELFLEFDNRVAINTLSDWIEEEKQRVTTTD